MPLLSSTAMGRVQLQKVDVEVGGEYSAVVVDKTMTAGRSENDRQAQTNLIPDHD